MGRKNCRCFSTGFGKFKWRLYKWSSYDDKENGPNMMIEISEKY